jgi:hypothetical protein
MGIKETKEVVTLGRVITIIILKAAQKDGFQWQDLGAFLNSPEFSQAVVPAVDGIQSVGKELVDLDFFEALELSRHVYGEAMAVLDVLKGAAKK